MSGPLTLGGQNLTNVNSQSNIRDKFGAGKISGNTPSNAAGSINQNGKESSGGGMPLSIVGNKYSGAAGGDYTAASNNNGLGALGIKRR